MELMEMSRNGCCDDGGVLDESRGILANAVRGMVYKGLKKDVSFYL